MTAVQPKSSDRPGPTRPLVFAHRGASAALPEHTLEAYLRAIDDGADGLECDVRLTRDGTLICIHDPRLERTSNGRGRVSAATLAELAELDFSSWHAAGVGGARGVLTLERLLTTAKEAGRPLRVLVETKHPTRFGGAVERELVALLHRLDLQDDQMVRVTAMSFSASALARLRRLAPTLPTVFLTDLALPGVRAGRLPFGARIVGPGIRAVRARPELVEQARARGHQVYVWTVNRPEDVELVLELGVDGVISDRPEYVLSRVAS
jgi:glycerophosphoryl diester phosphodiesterase